MKHYHLTKQFLTYENRVDWHNQALLYVRLKRDRSIYKISEWENLREAASQIKLHTLSHIKYYIEQFFVNATKNGFIVHFAKDFTEHNKIVYEILKKHNVKKVVKSKSMLTEECGLNSFLENHGIEIIDTDLGERIVQLRKEHPSHIVLPAIHLKKEDVAKTFAKYLNTDPHNNDPVYLTRNARKHLREKFLNAQAGITGVNFAIAETGGFVICTNEGNADLGTTLPKLHIACMGVEKIIPKLKDLTIFLRILAPSATGQAITSYTTLYQKPNQDQEVHIIIVDNGRSDILKQKEFRNALKCIRCGACLNTCPVYRRSGGHSYHATIPGPIGSILNPHKNKKEYWDLPFASSLCGSCSNICPVKIDIHNQLFLLRQKLKDYKQFPRYIFSFMNIIFSKPDNMLISHKIIFFLRTLIPNFIFRYFFEKKYQRVLPEIPKKSFRQIYKENYYDKIK
ncbi:MAG: 4Fe-4S ferredoxin [Leptospiraceae bacterium]|nr:MAG: 4Fe-4S ferredoxin [Leptospiraceae bacterium]